MAVYETDRRWSDRYIDAIRAIIGPRLLVTAPWELDRKQNTDLMVLTARDMTIACRVRRPGYASRYGWDVTLRAARDTGAETELAKVVKGWGDWMFYAHALDGDRIGFERWFLLDLHALRVDLTREGVRSALDMPLRMGGLFKRQGNGDGTHFVAFDVRDFPLVVLASSVPQDEAA